MDFLAVARVKSATVHIHGRAAHRAFADDCTYKIICIDFRDANISTHYKRTWGIFT